VAAHQLSLPQSQLQSVLSLLASVDLRQKKNAQDLKHMLVHFFLLSMKSGDSVIIHLQSSDNTILKDKVQQSLMEPESMMDFLTASAIIF
jgi:hypothetical protein